MYILDIIYMLNIVSTEKLQDIIQIFALYIFCRFIVLRKALLVGVTRSNKVNKL